MRAYRCYFLGADGRIAALEIFEAESDEDALAQAVVLAGRRQYRAIEIWDCGRRVYPQARGKGDVDEIKRAFDSIAVRQSKDADRVS